MTGPVALAAACGLVLGVGLWLLVALAPRLGGPSLIVRVAPYVVDVSSDARLLLDRRTADPLPLFGAIFAPGWGRVRRWTLIAIGRSEATAGSLRRAGSRLSVDDFRSRQLLWAAIAAGAGFVVDGAVGTAQAVPVIAQLALVLITAGAGFVGRELVLRRSAAARARRMTNELPTMLEFMTLSLSAGEGMLDAIRRVSRISRGELAAEFGRVLAAVSTGLPLALCLRQLASDLRLPPLTRAIDQVLGALERGTPLAEVLRAQAGDARDESKRELLELSGKKEVAMMVPLVFLILPITIAIAIFPGVYVLSLGL
jgi:tight adherence protein C